MLYATTSPSTLRCQLLEATGLHASFKKHQKNKVMMRPLW